MNYGRLSEVLDEQEQTYIKQFMDNEKMCGAVKKALLLGLYEDGTLKKGKKANGMYNAALSFVSGVRGEMTNDEVGAGLRALWEGLNALEAGFNALSVFKTELHDKERSENPAR